MRIFSEALEDIESTCLVPVCSLDDDDDDDVVDDDIEGRGMRISGSFLYKVGFSFLPTKRPKT